MEFKKTYSFRDRYEESRKIIKKYPDKIPIVCEKHNNLSNLPNITKSKYLVSFDLTVGQFIYIIRKYIRITPETALYIFVNNNIPSTTTDMLSLYDNFKDQDGFLYIYYLTETTFG
jgi:GABA(A) receptor-associated protein